MQFSHLLSVTARDPGREEKKWSKRRPGRVQGASTAAAFWVLTLLLGFFAFGSAHAADEDFSYFPCPFKEDKADGKWGYIDRTGRVVIEPVYNDAFTFREGLARVAGDNWKIGFMDAKGKIVIQPRFEDVSNFHDGMAGFPVPRGGFQTKIGYINREGKAIPQVFDKGDQFSEDLAPVSPDGKKWGFIDKTGKFVIEATIDGACPTIHRMRFSDGLFCAKIGDREGFIDRVGKMVIDTAGLDVLEFHEGLAAIRSEAQSDRLWFIDKTGKTVFEVHMNTFGA